MPLYGYIDSSGIDVGNKGYVTKDYVMEWYPLLAPDLVSSQRWASGIDYKGQLGDGSTTTKSSPVITFGGGTGWQKLGETKYNTVGMVKADNTAALVGQNQFGQLGDGTTVDKSVPVGTTVGAWRDIACGYAHTLAVRQGGVLFTTGYNALGQLGDNTATNKSTFAQASFTPQIYFRQVSAGWNHSAAMSVNDGLYLCGSNLYGQLGDGTTVNKSSFTAVANLYKQVSCGRYHTAGIRVTGGLWTCGYNVDGELGDGTTVNKSTLATVAGGTLDWKQVSCGHWHTAAVKIDGTLWTWGYNIRGQLGDGTNVGKSSPVTTIIGGTNWKQVSCGDYHTAAVKTDGTLWVWGSNTSGQLADGTLIDKSSPIRYSLGGTSWKQVSCTAAAIQAVTETGGW